MTNGEDGPPPEPRQTGYECSTGIGGYPQTGTHDYTPTGIEKDTPCAPPAPSDEALATLDAMQKLMLFGKTLCAVGNVNCNSRQCVPSLSNVKHVETTSSSAVVGEGAAAKKHCYVHVTIAGDISCACA